MFFFVAFTKEQFDYVLSRVVSFSICVGIASLGLTAVDSVANSAMTTKGTRNKITTTIVTIFYTIAVCLIFAISLVSTTDNSDLFIIFNY